MSGKQTAIRTDILSGLGKEELAESRRRYGTNTLTRTKRKSFFSKFVSNLKDPIIKILIGAMVINVAFMIKNVNWPEEIGIACAVLTATLVSTVSEYGSERAFDRLSAAASGGKITVVRDGLTKDTDVTSLAVGDVYYLRAGMMIPADSVIVSGNVSVCESPLTGESRDVKKSSARLGRTFDIDVSGETYDKANYIYKGCLCTGGECTAAAVKIGDMTEYGKIACGLSREDRKSPLKERLSELAKSVSIIGYVAAFLIMAAYLFNVIVIDANWSHDVIASRLTDLKFMISSVMSAVTLGVSVIVVAVPEGLPMMITVVLSSNMKKMLRSGVLVRKMVGIETAGSMNILFTDKTGTLTTGNMTVNRIYTSSGVFGTAHEFASHPFYRSFIPILTGPLIGKAGRTPTENAIVKFFKSSKVSANVKTLERLAFTSENKYSGCLIERSGAESCFYLGGAEKLLSMCDRYADENGTERKLDSALNKRLFGVIEKEAGAKSRMLALTRSDAECWDGMKAGVSSPLVFISFISVRDELRRDVKESVAAAKSAGIQIVMMTGDNKETASAIARESGIAKDGSLILTGGEISEMTDSELISVMPRLAVVARALPSDKERLVDISHKMGLVSGMTGDGINDAPSLKASDVGFAMGSGSDVAKEAADIILTNDSFSSITRAVLFGRCVFESIRKFITFQLMMNLCALGVSLIGPFIGVESPITVIQMLWVNIIMDTLGGLAFAGEIPLREYMKRPPVRRLEKILTKSMVAQILFCGVYTLALCISFLKIPFFRSILSQDGDVYFLTCFFALFIFCGIFNSFNARAPRGHLFSHISGNKAFILIIFFVAVVQLAIIYLGGDVFRCCPVTAKDLFITSVLSFTVIPADQLRKLITKKCRR